MARQINLLQDFRKPTKRAIKGISSNLIIGCNACRHGLWLSHGVYCTLQREKIEENACEVCRYFDPEPSEYKLFRRM